MGTCSSSCDSAEYQILVCIKNILQSAVSGDKTISELLGEIVEVFSNISFEGATIDMNQLTELDVSGIECRIQGTNDNISLIGPVIELINNALSNLNTALATTFTTVIDSETGTINGTTAAGAMFARYSNMDDAITATVNGASLPPGKSIEFSVPGPQFELPAIAYDSGVGGNLRRDVLTKNVATTPAIDAASIAYDDLSSCTPA